MATLTKQLNFLAFVIGIILGVLKLVGVQGISWWAIGALTIGPWLVYVCLMMIVGVGVAAAASVDIDPTSHIKRKAQDDSKDVLCKYCGEPFDLIDRVIGWPYCKNGHPLPYIQRLGPNTRQR